MTAAELEAARASDTLRHEMMAENDRQRDAAAPESPVHELARQRREGMRANGVRLAPSKLDRPMTPATPIKATAPIKATTNVARGTSRERTSATPTRAGPSSAADDDPGGGEPPLDPFDAAIAAADALGLQPRLSDTRQASSKCPGPRHDDRRASLSIGEGLDGRVLLHCHAGCTFAEIRAALLEGVDSSRPTRRIVASRPITAPAARITEQLVEEYGAALHLILTRAHARSFGERLLARRWTWGVLRQCEVGWDTRRFVFPYRDVHGTLTGAARYTDRPGRGTKTMATAGSVRGLFPAVERIPGLEVLLVEGEPDALAGLSVGLPAVGVPGANGWKPEWASRFTGRRVIVCMDADEPGRKAAATIAADLEGVAGGVRVIELDQTRTDGFDLTDLLRELADQGRHVPSAVREVIA